MIATAYRVVDLADRESESAATAWWTELTESGGEGAVVKPLAFVATGSRGLLQPAVKCRGREYLRIIYGPEYTLPEHLERLRERGLSLKRSLALREFALGVEGLEHPETRTEASETLRGLIEAIVLTPHQGELRIVLKGNLAAMLGAAQKAKRSSESDDLFLQVSLVAGAGFEPAPSGL